MILPKVITLYIFALDLLRSSPPKLVFEKFSDLLVSVFVRDPLPSLHGPMVFSDFCHAMIPPERHRAAMRECLIPLRMYAKEVAALTGTIAPAWMGTETQVRPLWAAERLRLIHRWSVKREYKYAKSESVRKHYEHSHKQPYFLNCHESFATP